MAASIKPFSDEEKSKASLVFLALLRNLDLLTDQELSRLKELIIVKQLDREDEQLEAYALSGRKDNLGCPA